MALLAPENPVASAARLAARLRTDATALADLPRFLASLEPDDLARTQDALAALTAAIEREDPITAADELVARWIPLAEGRPPDPLGPGLEAAGREGGTRRWVSAWSADAEADVQLASLDDSATVLLCGAARGPLLARMLAAQRPILVWEDDDEGRGLARATLATAGQADRLLPCDLRPGDIDPGPARLDLFLHPALGRAGRDRALGAWAALRLRRSLPPASRPATLDVWILDRGRTFHGETEIGVGLIQAGHRVQRTSPRDLVRRLLGGERPDLVVSVNLAALVLDPEVAALLRAAEVGVVAWFVDEPLAALRQPHRFVHDRLLALTWERDAVPRLRRWGFAADYLPLAAAVPSGASAGGATLKVSWVASSYRGTERQRLGAGAPSGPVATHLRQLASTALLSNRRLSPAATWEALSRLDGAEPALRRLEDRIFLQTASADDAAAGLRAELARALAPLGLDVFGDLDGWNQLDTGARLHPPCRGTERFEVFARSRVNLDLVHPQMPTAVSQRAFEVPAAGGLLVADDRPDLRDHYDVGREVLAYSDPGEAHELADWALRNPRAAARISAAGQRRAHHEHTAHHRARRLVQLAREHRIV